MLTIIDYGVGNLASIKNMLKRVGCDAAISSEETAIRDAEKIILPGVGAFDTCAKKLHESGLLTVLNKKVLEDKIPVLGVCVGMQLLAQGSEEGSLPGLGWIQGKNVKFKSEKLPSHLKIPHMGWTEVVINKASRLFDGMYKDPRFYFVHSFHPEVDNPEDALIYATHGYPFVAGIEHDNILGVQFHPEKSHKFGMKLLDNFVTNY